MTTEEIKSGEISIAKFCGWKLLQTFDHPEGKKTHQWELEINNNRLRYAYTYNYDINDGSEEHELAYSADIFWLYGAWEKFRDLKFDGKLFLQHKEIKQRIKDAIMDKGVFAGFEEMLKGVEFYNEYQTYLK